MCKVTSPLCRNGSSDHHYLVSINDSKEPKTLTSPLISKTITPQPEQVHKSQFKPHKKSHFSLALKEANSIAAIAFPMILTGLLLYLRSMISMLFLGRLGELALAGGSLAVGFANITGYSILSGLAMGMEPICGQAFGAKKHTLLGLSLQRMVLLLLFTSLPISLLWLNMKKILLICGQDEAIAAEAQLYLLCSLPDLLAQSFLHPLRIYLRSQSITLPLTLCATLAIILHIPINYLLVSHLDLGIKGVALSGVWSNFNLVASVIVYIIVSGVHKKTWGGISMDCFREWRTLLNLAGSCALTMLVVLGRTDWEFEARKAKELTGAAAAEVAVGDSEDVEEDKPSKAEIKEDCLCLLGDYKPYREKFFMLSCILVC
ncbi:unnamed protein product [Malus baccata var. baccata]